MAKIITLNVWKKDNSDLFVYENILPNPIVRFFFIKNLKSNNVRGGHKNIKSHEGLVCIEGKCEVRVVTKNSEDTYILDNPSKCILIEPNEWHVINNFSENTILLAFCDDHFNADHFSKDI